MRQIILVAHNIRSAHNVGSLLRTADGLGIEKVYLTGYTPYPHFADDARLPHLSAKITKQIHKTALGAEGTISWKYVADPVAIFETLRDQGYRIVALEQAPNAIALPDYQPPSKLALVVGREVEGLESEILAEADEVIEILMAGQKESFNVVQAAAMALYHCKYK